MRRRLKVIENIFYIPFNRDANGIGDVNPRRLRS